MSSRYLYRAYDSDNNLLYLGQTATPLERKAIHMTRSGWAGDVTEWRITGPFPAESILRLEAEAILREQPQFNRAGKKKPKSKPKLHPADAVIGATIREMRTMRGFTQDDLSRAAMLSRAYVANIEAGRKRPSMRAVARIASALHVPQISIIARDEAVAA